MNGPSTVGSQESSSSAVRLLTTLSPHYKECSETCLSCQYYRGNVKRMSILILNFYSFACLWNILAPLHEDYTLVINISIPQPPFLGCINHVFLPLPSYWLIHAFSELLLQKKAGREKKKKAGRDCLILRQGFLYIHLDKMVKYDLGWSANEGWTRIDVLITEWRKASCCNRFFIYMIEVMDGDSALEEFEFKVALLSRRLTCWSPATPLWSLRAEVWCSRWLNWLNWTNHSLLEQALRPWPPGWLLPWQEAVPTCLSSSPPSLLAPGTARQEQGMAVDRAVGVWLWPALETLFQSLPSSWLASCNGLGF